MPLSETTLLKAAGDLVYARGEGYVRFVRGLRTTDFKAYASIQAKNVYQVELDWSGPLRDGFCTCRHRADGHFCKHLVATGLAAIDTGRVAVDDTANRTAEAALEAVVRAMDVDDGIAGSGVMQSLLPASQVSAESGLTNRAPW